MSIATHIYITFPKDNELTQEEIALEHVIHCSATRPKRNNAKPHTAETTTFSGGYDKKSKRPSATELSPITTHSNERPVQQETAKKHKKNGIPSPLQNNSYNVCSGMNTTSPNVASGDSGNVLITSSILSAPLKAIVRKDCAIEVTIRIGSELKTVKNDTLRVVFPSTCGNKTMATNASSKSKSNSQGNSRGGKKKGFQQLLSVTHTQAEKTVMQGSNLKAGE